MHLLVCSVKTFSLCNSKYAGLYSARIYVTRIATYLLFITFNCISDLGCRFEDVHFDVFCVFPVRRLLNLNRGGGAQLRRLWILFPLVYMKYLIF